MGEQVIQLPADRAVRSYQPTGIKRPPGLTAQEWKRYWSSEYNRRYRQSVPVEIRSASVRVWKQQNRDRARELNRQSAERTKLAVFALYGGICQRCGFADARALQLDHIDGCAGQDRRAGQRSGLALYRLIIRGQRDSAQFQLLCANCNWIKRSERQECPRGRPHG